MMRPITSSASDDDGGASDANPNDADANRNVDGGASPTPPMSCGGRRSLMAFHYPAPDTGRSMRAVYGVPLGLTNFEHLPTIGVLNARPSSAC